MLVAFAEVIGFLAVAELDSVSGAVVRKDDFGADDAAVELSAGLPAFAAAFLPGPAARFPPASLVTAFTSRFTAPTGFAVAFLRAGAFAVGFFAADLATALLPEGFAGAAFFTARDLPGACFAGARATPFFAEAGLLAFLAAGFAAAGRFGGAFFVAAFAAAGFFAGDLPALAFAGDFLPLRAGARLATARCVAD